MSGGLNHFGYRLLFENRGGPCTLHGYPGVSGLAADGNPVVQFQRTPFGYLGGSGSEPTVELQTGQVASALYEGLIGPPSGAPPCPNYSTLLVTPPNDTQPARIPSPYGLCYPQIHPIVAGTTGGANTPN